MVSPNKADRDYAREVHLNASLPFLEVFVDAPLEVVQHRDPKGLYALAKQGKITDLPGLDAPYAKPETPDVHLKTHEKDVTECVNIILRKLDAVGIHLPRRFQLLDNDEDFQETC